MTIGMRAKPLLTGLLLSIGLLLAPTMSLAQAPQRGAFVLLIGTDTFAVENFSRGPDSLTSELFGPSLGLIRFSAKPDATALVSELTLQFWTPGADATGMPNQGATLTVTGDTVNVDITMPPGVQVQRMPSRPGAFLFLNPSFLLIEQMIRHARAAGGGVLQLPVYMAQGGETGNIVIRAAETDSVGIIMGAEIRVVMDSDGLLRSAAIPAQGLSIVRVDDTHLPAVHR